MPYILSNHTAHLPQSQAGGGAIRHALSKLEGGVCVTCGVDCRALVAALQCIRHGGRDWEARRTQVLSQRFPR